MKRPLEILAEDNTMKSIVGMTSAFESLSSMKIMQTKGRVLHATEFFNEVWNIYKQIRVDVMFNFGRAIDESPIDREVLILITARSGLSGDIDQRLIRRFKEYYDPDKHDIICIGHHGLQQLEQTKIKPTLYLDIPKGDFINVDPLINVIKQYAKSHIFYQDYISLSQQEVIDVDLGNLVSSRGKIADIEYVEPDKITEKTYIFEPSTYAVAAHLEVSVLSMTLAQFIFDSKLAQLASRFRAMTAAKERSIETEHELMSQYRRAKRALVDVRLKESLVGLKKIRAGGGE
jgi:ATP synthase F1 gamma subunit